MPWLDQLTSAVFREYDRRIKRASLVTEYGAGHHAHDDHGHDEHDAPADLEIANVPRGTPVAEPVDAPATPIERVEVEPFEPPPSPPRPAAAGDAEEGEIVNAPPGAPV